MKGGALDVVADVLRSIDPLDRGRLALLLRAFLCTRQKLGRLASRKLLAYSLAALLNFDESLGNNGLLLIIDELLKKIGLQALGVMLE